MPGDITLKRLHDSRCPMIEAESAPVRPRTWGAITGTWKFLEALADPRHPDHEHMVEWIGDAFDPEAFDAHEANLAIHGGWVRRKD